MKLDTLYRKAVSIGIANDPRGTEAVRRILDDERTRSEKLEAGERDAWEADRLFNPYADTRLLAGDPAAEVRTLIVGIDMDAAEVLLAHTLNRDRAAGIDARRRPPSPGRRPGPAPRRHARPSGHAGRLRRQYLRRRTAHGQEDRRGGAARPSREPRPGRGRGPPARPADDVRAHAGRQLRQHLPREALRKGEALSPEGPRRPVEKHPRVPGGRPAHGRAQDRQRLRQGPLRQDLGRDDRRHGRRQDDLRIATPPRASARSSACTSARRPSRTPRRPTSTSSWPATSRATRWG